MSWQVIQGDCLDTLLGMDDDSIDAIVTDPPYGLSNHKPAEIASIIENWIHGRDDAPGPKGRGFMGKEWDAFVPGPEVWRECLRVLKPGGHMCVFAGSRTVDLMGLSVRLAGFEIRDMLQYLYGSGFPKSTDPAFALHKKAEQAAKHDVRFVLGTHLQAPVYACRECGQVLLTPLSEQGAQERWRSWSKSKTPGTEQPSVEGWGHLEEGEGELSRCEICAMSHGICADGQAGRLRDGASAGYGPMSSEVPNASGGGSSHRSRPKQQSPGESDAVSLERCAQKIRGTGTALKPAHEPIILARKPFKGTIAANVQEHGTGGINVDGCRIATTPEDLAKLQASTAAVIAKGGKRGESWKNSSDLSGANPVPDAGRWPANVILDEEAGAMLDAQSGNRPGMSGGGKHRTRRQTIAGGGHDGNESHIRSDNGGASRFFYCAKASKSEREAGLDDFDEIRRRDGRDKDIENPRLRTTERCNHHPTVKPLSLMRWLVRLITPPGGVVLDPFNGSGSTGCAAVLEGFDYVGLELDPEYVAIAEARIAHWEPKPFDPCADREERDNDQDTQGNLFDA